MLARTALRILRASCALTVAALWACDGIEPIVGHVQGTVTIEGEPLGSITVHLQTDTVRTVVTDASGRFSFEVGDGTYMVGIEGTPVEATFAETSRTVQISTTGQIGQADFQGTWIRTSSIAGRVVANGEPVVGILVAVTGPSTADARTDETGAFHISNLRAGSYRVELRGYDPERYQFPTLTLDASAGVGEVADLDFSGEVLPPLAPVALQAASDGPYRVHVTWQDMSAYEAEYRVERRSAQGAWEELAVLGPGATELVDEDLTPGTTYGYRVVACNEVGCSVAGVEAEARTDQIPPDPPTSLTAVPVSAFRVDLTWVDASFNEAGFHLERRVGQGEWSELAVIEPGATNYSDTDLSPDTDYEYRLRACNEVGCSDFAGPVAVTTPVLPPAAPAALAAVAAGATQVDLTWQDLSDNEDTFELERSSGGAWSTVTTRGAGAVAHSDTGLIPGTTYSYRVKACNEGGCSPASNEAGATTDQIPPPSPTALSAIATAPDRVDLTWLYGGANEDGFHVERRIKNQGAFAEVAIAPVGSTGHADQGVEVGKTFEYRVRACNEVGCSNYSNVAEATTVAPPENNLQVAAVHLTQVVQTLGGSVPLIQGRSGLLRVWVTTGLANAFQPDVRVRLYDGANLIQESIIPAPSASVPLSVDEGSLTASWNLPVSAAQIGPGLGVQVDVDPGNAVAETNESDNVFPASGTHAFNVQTTGAFDVVFVPVRQSVNGLEGAAGGGAGFTGAAQAMFPVTSIAGQGHGVYVTDAPELQSGNGNGAWGTILSEVAALRAADGSSLAYYGAVKVSYGGGVAGMGYIGAPISIGWDKGGAAGIAAHEWGHNFGRRHAPCGGAGNPDGSYPHAGGSIGVYGYNGSSLLSPATYKDLMGYCSPDWISDYTYSAIMSFFGGAPAPPASASRAPEDGLLIWGRIDENGVVLEPAFQITAPAMLPDGPGPYRIRGFDAAGNEIFSLSFEGDELPAEAGEGRHFAFVVPLSRLGGRELGALRLEGPGAAAVRAATPGAAPGEPEELEVRPMTDGEVEVTWNSGRYPMALVRDASTGQVISFARGGDARVPVSGDRVEVVLSDGVRSVSRSLPVR